VPRTNRGIFAINELPDLAERIQVGLLNVLEERDVQVRGYKIRLPLDIVLVASANPEDYTNRGRIITPLKDRFGAQVRTHYPPTVDIERAIVDQEATPFDADGINVRVPDYMDEVVATLSHLARASGNINQRSGVSVRLTVSNRETLVANAARRAIGHGETEVVPRVSDLDAITSSTLGKVEIETLEDGRESQIVDQLIKSATLTVFKDRVAPEGFRAVLEAFESGLVANAGEDVPAAEYVRLVSEQPALRSPVQSLTEGDESPGMVASAVEFLLEGLHLSKRLNKDAMGSRAAYRARS
jgi:magnesium chelatase subunit I